MSKESNPRGFKIQGARDINRIQHVNEKYFAEFLLRKSRIYDIWYEGVVVVSENQATLKRSTIPDFTIINKKTGKVTHIEITMVNRSAFDKDPKESQKEIMRCGLPDESYIVFYGEQLKKLRKRYGFPFANGNGHDNKGKKNGRRLGV